MEFSIVGYSLPWKIINTFQQFSKFLFCGLIALKHFHMIPQIRAFSLVAVLTIRRLKKLGANNLDLIDVYIKQVRSLLEFAVVVWHPSLRGEDRVRIERVQKSALCIILGDTYHSYRSALKQVKLESLFSRRNKLCKKFAKKSLKNSKFSKWFKPNDRKTSTRLIKLKFC